MDYAQNKGYIKSYSFPTTPTGRTRRKSIRKHVASKVLGLQALPNARDLHRPLEALVNHQPQSRRYRAMTAVGALAGLRPGEVAVLERADLRKTPSGEPYLSVTKAWQGVGASWGSDEEDVATPKTAQFRDVMITKSLVREIELWCEMASISDGPQFLVEDRPPTNWGGRSSRPARRRRFRRSRPTDSDTPTQQRSWKPECLSGSSQLSSATQSRFSFSTTSVPSRAAERWRPPSLSTFGLKPLGDLRFSR